MEFTKEELELIKDVMNALGSVLPEKDKLAESIWNKLDDAEVKDTEYEKSIEKAYDELVENNNSSKDNKEGITFYHIGGYECLRDGTQEDETVSTLKELQEFADDWDLEFDEDSTDFKELLGEIAPQWEERWDDGGGSGWYE